MKEYILYIVVGLAIAGVVAVYFITNKKIASIENQIGLLNNNFNKLSSIINTNNQLSNEDPFNETVNNLGGSYNSTINSTSINNIPKEDYNQSLDNKQRDGLVSNSSSTGQLKDEIENLKKDIGNIEDLIDDSSAESNNDISDIVNSHINSNNDGYIDPDIYNQQLANLKPESINQETINKINSITNNSVDINYRNNSSEFDDLGNTEIENNSEFNNILENDGKTIDKIEGEIQSLEDNLKDLDFNKISLEKKNSNSQENTINIDVDLNDSVKSIQETKENKSPEIIIKKKSVKINKLTDIEAQVIADKYSKRELSDICNELSISKSGTKKKTVNRIHKSDLFI